MISYPLNPPAALKIRSIRLTMEDAVMVSTSPYTFAEQAQAHQGQRWVADVVSAPVHGADAAACKAWFAALRGRFGIFCIGDSSQKTPFGTAVGTPVVYGAGQTGMSLVTSGWGVSQTVLKAGDYIQLGAVNEFTNEFTSEFGSDGIARLHQVVEDVVSDSSGNATISIWPRLRSSPANGAAITTSNCKGTFRLAENERSWEAGPDKIITFSFRAVEAL